MSLAFQMKDLKGIFVELPLRPSEEPVSSMSLYKQVQGSDLTWTPPPGIPPLRDGRARGQLEGAKLV